MNFLELRRVLAEIAGAILAPRARLRQGYGALLAVVAKTLLAPRAGFESAFAEATAGQASNPPVNRQKMADLRGDAEVCGESPKREIEPINIGAIDDLRVAATSRSKRRLGALKGQENGKVETD